MLTALEHRAVLNALEWLRGEYDCAYAIERGIKGAEVGALTRAIRKLGGDPYPKAAPSIMLGGIIRQLEIERNAERRRQDAGEEIEPVGIKRHGEISFDVDFSKSDRPAPRRRIGFMRGEEQ